MSWMSEANETLVEKAMKEPAPFEQLTGWYVFCPDHEVVGRETIDLAAGWHPGIWKKEILVSKKVVAETPLQEVPTMIKKSHSCGYRYYDNPDYTRAETWEKIKEVKNPWRCNKCFKLYEQLADVVNCCL